MQNQNYEDVVSAIYKHCIGAQETEVKLDVASYRNNGTMAVQLFSRMEDYMGDCPSSEQLPFENPYAVITVNLPDSERLAANEQFVDLNNLPDIGRWLVQNNIAEPTEHMAQSGYCTYQAFAFHLPDRLINKIVTSREDSIAERLINEIEASGMKPAEKNDRGELYKMSAYGKDSPASIIIYKGTSPKELGTKKDIFLLAHHAAKGEQMWRFRNLPEGVRKDIATQIGNAIRHSRGCHM